MRKLIFYISLTLIANKSFTQDNDHWEVYMAQYEKMPGSTLVNMSLKEKAPVQQFGYLLITGVTFKNCTSDGFPTQSEFDKLYAVSDSVRKIVASTVKYLAVGTFTHECERTDFFYISDTSHLRQKLTALYKKRFPAYTPIIKLKEDKEWKAYLTFLYPNDETIEYIKNDKVVMKLQEAGDKLEKERLVDHWLYFKTSGDRDNFINYAKAHQFKIETTETVKNTKLPFQLHLTRTDKVDLPSISQITLQLRKEALKYNGQYDGWETFVVR